MNNDKCASQFATILLPPGLYPGDPQGGRQDNPHFTFDDIRKHHPHTPPFSVFDDRPSALPPRFSVAFPEAGDLKVEMEMLDLGENIPNGINQTELFAVRGENLFFVERSQEAYFNHVPLFVPRGYSRSMAAEFKMKDIQFGAWDSACGYTLLELLFREVHDKRGLDSLSWLFNPAMQLAELKELLGFTKPKEAPVRDSKDGWTHIAGLVNNTAHHLSRGASSNQNARNPIERNTVFGYAQAMLPTAPDANAFLFTSITTLALYGPVNV